MFAKKILTALLLWAPLAALPADIEPFFEIEPIEDLNPGAVSFEIDTSTIA